MKILIKILIFFIGVACQVKKIVVPGEKSIGIMSIYP